MTTEPKKPKTPKTPQSQADHDSPWKDALEHYFEEFLHLLFPAIYVQIDWSKGYSFLDKELQKITADAQTGRHHADKLAKVYALNGQETWVLIHAEVQGKAETEFPARMYRYQYRIHDRYAVDVVSIAVLTDTNRKFHPKSYQYARWGCELVFKFPTVKLIDWEKRWSELESSDNVFALVVMAQIKAKRVKKGDVRKEAKIALIRILYERGYNREQIIRLFTVIDWMIELPKGLEQDFLQTIYAIEEDKRMPYINTAERIGMEKGFKLGHQEGRQEGHQEGRQEGLQEGEQKGQQKGQHQGIEGTLRKLITLKFGELPAWADERLTQASDAQLDVWVARILTADSLEGLLAD
jgi:hypothetical protein